MLNIDSKWLESQNALGWKGPTRIRRGRTEKFLTQSFPPHSVPVSRLGRAGWLWVDKCCLGEVFFTPEGWLLLAGWWNRTPPAPGDAGSLNSSASYTLDLLFFLLPNNLGWFFREESFPFTCWLSPQKQQTITQEVWSWNFRFGRNDGNTSAGWLQSRPHPPPASVASNPVSFFLRVSPFLRRRRWVPQRCENPSLTVLFPAVKLPGFLFPSGFRKHWRFCCVRCSVTPHQCLSGAALNKHRFKSLQSRTSFAVIRVGWFFQEVY